MARNSEHAPSKRSTIRQSANRAVYNEDVLKNIIDQGIIATVSISVDNEPFVMPLAIARIDDKVYLHGLKTSRIMMQLASGAPVCICVTHLDGIIVARSGMHCSANYRSAVIHGEGQSIEGDEKARLLHQIVTRIIPGSEGDYRDHLDKELKATTLIAIPLNEAVCKVRTGGPIDDDEDLALPYWAGEIPITQVYGEPIPSADLPDGIETPEYARNYQRPLNGAG
ncbi:MAG: pyridoxamine 5'-phosphate oxidase family protein [Pseudomonadales bacterium]|jgi:nitroimidazol reductase NimA-like FMN-containing flavoprotein (pyridoxamine 5'-phosphate oxidase superfamily)